jgi:hypothetical protein
MGSLGNLVVFRTKEIKEMKPFTPSAFILWNLRSNTLKSKKIFALGGGLMQ